MDGRVHFQKSLTLGELKPCQRDLIDVKILSQKLSVSKKRTNTGGDWGRVHFSKRGGETLLVELDRTSEGVVPTSQLVTAATSDTALSSSASSQFSNKDFSKDFLQNILAFSCRFWVVIILLKVLE